MFGLPNGGFFIIILASVGVVVVVLAIALHRMHKAVIEKNALEKDD